MPFKPEQIRALSAKITALVGCGAGTLRDRDDLLWYNEPRIFESPPRWIRLFQAKCQAFEKDPDAWPEVAIREGRKVMYEPFRRAIAQSLMAMARLTDTCSRTVIQRGAQSGKWAPVPFLDLCDMAVLRSRRHQRVRKLLKDGDSHKYIRVQQKVELTEQGYRGQCCWVVLRKRLLRELGVERAWQEDFWRKRKDEQEAKLQARQNDPGEAERAAEREGRKNDRQKCDPSVRNNAIDQMRHIISAYEPPTEPDTPTTS